LKLFISKKQKMTTHTKLATLITFVVMMAFSTGAFAQNIAFIDSEAVLPHMPAYKKAKSDIEAYGAQLQKVLEVKQVEMRAYIQEKEKLRAEGRLNQLQVQEVQLNIQKMEASLQKELREADQKLILREKELTKPVYDAFNKAIATVAKANGYAYVLDKQFLLYHMGCIDATEKIKTELGISW